MKTIDPKKLMQCSVDRLESDLDRITSIVRAVESELDNVRGAADSGQLLLAMKAQLGEIHARLEGAKEFVGICRRRALEPATEMENDIWL